MFETVKEVINYFKELSTTVAGKNILYVLLGACTPLFFIYFENKVLKEKESSIDNLIIEVNALKERNRNLIDENKELSYECDRRVFEAKDKALETVKRTVDLVDQLRAEKKRQDMQLKKVVDEEKEIVKKYENMLQNIKQ